MQGKYFPYQSLIVVVTILVSQLTFAAQQGKEKIFERLTTSMEQVRQGEVVTLDSREILATDPQWLLTALAPFEKDPSPKVRREAYIWEWLVGRQASNPAIRKSVVERLVGAYFDSDRDVSYASSEQLVSFGRDDFTEQAKTSLRQQLDTADPRRELMLVAGVADLQDQIPKLQRLRSNATDYESVSTPGIWYGLRGWHARLALARMGSQEDIEHCITMVESHPDHIIRVTRLLRDLAYIRQPEVINVLQKYLESDEHFPKESFTFLVFYNQYAIDLLAQILEDFPVESKESGGYSQEDINTARAWIKAQTEFKIKR